MHTEDVPYVHAEPSPTTYTYDANNRLISEVSDKTGTDVLISYTYDDNGNLLSQLDVNSTAIATYNLKNGVPQFKLWSSVLFSH